jgi:hypothetical protein
MGRYKLKIKECGKEECVAIITWTIGVVCNT